jgi:hypothetical protein
MLEQPRNRIKGEARMREIQDDQGRRWQAVAIPETVAHMRSGAVLGFRDANADGSEPVRAPVTFNSVAAAELAIGSMSEWELKRRLSWAQTEAGVA